MQPLKAVFFDLDDTLLWDDRSVDEAFQATADYAASQANINAQQLVDAVKESARMLYATYDFYSFTQMIGINPFEGLWGKFTKGDHPMFRSMEATVPKYRTQAWTNGLLALGVDDGQLGHRLGEMFATERRARPYYYEETLEVLRALKQKYRLLMLTNGSPDLQNEKLTMSPDVVPYFDKIVISGNFGKGKPAIELFQFALDEIGVSKDEAIMVGDKLTTDILGSNRIGMKSVWINHHNKVRDENDAIPTFEIKRLKELLELV
jgi:putative hydrolase of the HAD superfamily